MENMRDLFGLHEAVAVVTGGSGVLGSALARGLARAGARVAVLGRRLAATQAVAEAIIAAGGMAIAVAGDVLRPEEMRRVAGEIRAAWGPATILVNGAGGNIPTATTNPAHTFFDLDPDAIEVVTRLNLSGTIIPSQVFGREMAESGRGVIVNIASMAALRPLTRVVGYGAAKAAVINFTQWLAVDLARSVGPGIRVNALAPGFFLTEQNRYLLTDLATGEMTARGAAILAHTPLGRFGDPADLVGALIWLVGPSATFVTGTVIPIDGGFAAQSGV